MTRTIAPKQYRRRRLAPYSLDDGIGGCEGKQSAIQAQGRKRVSERDEMMMEEMN